MADAELDQDQYDMEGEEKSPEEKITDELLQRLDSAGMTLSQSRSEAIDGRHSTGIEEEWVQDEEYYEGIDEANRGEQRSWSGKPVGQPAAGDEDDTDPGSTIFLNVTRPYVDATSARMGDMLLPTDDRGWAIDATPIPEMTNIGDSKIPEDIKAQIKQQFPGDQAAAYNEMKRLAEEVKEIISIAKGKAKKAEKQIEDWHTESQYHSQVRLVIEDASRVGTGVLKGPYPMVKKTVAYINGELQIQEKIVAASTRIDYRNCYPDPACGENIHQGNFFWERDDITTKRVMELADEPDYIPEQIEKVLNEGPQEATKDFRTDSDRPGLRAPEETRKNMYEIWYYHGLIEREILEAADLLCNMADDDSEEDPMNYGEDKWISVSLTMINNRVVKITLNSLDTGEFPYDFMVWQRRSGMPWGMGIARQIRPAQRIINGGIRHMMDNAGIAGGPMLFYNDDYIQPAEGSAEVKPWKIWVAGDEWEPGMKVDDYMAFIKTPIYVEELKQIIDLGLKFAEDITGLPMIMQGQTNQRTPTTLGGMQMQNNNASTVLRRVARTFDDMITEPHVRRYYRYLLQNSEDDDMKGDFTIDAQGSSALVERDLQNQSIMSLGQYVMNPAFDIDPRKWMQEMLKSSKLDAKRFKYDDEEWKELVANMNKQPEDPRVAVEQLRAQTLEKLKMLDQQFEAGKLERDSQEKERDRQLEEQLAMLDHEFDIYLNEMKEEGSNARTIQQLKEKIASNTMKLKTQVQLSGTNAATPAVEPKGRAEEGRAFEQ